MANITISEPERRKMTQVMKTLESCLHEHVIVPVKLFGDSFMINAGAYDRVVFDIKSFRSDDFAMWTVNAYVETRIAQVVHQEHSYADPVYAAEVFDEFHKVEDSAVQWDFMLAYDSTGNEEALDNGIEAEVLSPMREFMTEWLASKDCEHYVR